VDTHSHSPVVALMYPLLLQLRKLLGVESERVAVRVTDWAPTGVGRVNSRSRKRQQAANTARGSVERDFDGLTIFADDDC
jgi:hypothetical protein